MPPNTPPMIGPIGGELPPSSPSASPVSELVADGELADVSEPSVAPIIAFCHTGVFFWPSYVVAMVNGATSVGWHIQASAAGSRTVFATACCPLARLSLRTRFSGQP